MKILAIGCAHGKFPKKLRNKLKKEKFDLILGIGDYADTSDFRKLEFEFWRKNIASNKNNFIKFVGKNKYKELIKKQSISQKNILEKLKKYGKSLLVIYGNSDILDNKAKKYKLKGIESQCRALKIPLLKSKTKKFNDFIIAGFSGYRVASAKGFIKLNKNDKKRIKNFNEEWEKRFNGLANKIKNQKNVIFVGHDVPYGYFDLIKNNASPLNGKKIGEKYFTSFIKKYQPNLFICAHMHEYQGIKKLGKTSIITTGAGQDGKAVVIDYNIGKKVKARFIK